MTFSIIGSGNIAWFLGTRMLSAGHHCIAVYSRNPDAAGQLAGVLASARYGYPGDVRDGEADICFLTVSDIAIGAIAAKLSLKQTVLIHTAGAVALDSITPAAQDCAVLWPVYSILKSSLPAHRSIPCAWEAGTPKAEKCVVEAAHAITDVFFEAKYEQRKWLHLAAVMSNNFMTHLAAICEQICTEHHLPFSVLVPIIDQTFDRLKYNAPHMLQTGPAIRHDSVTLQAQISLLGQHTAWQNIYKAITASIQSSGPLSQ